MTSMSSYPHQTQSAYTPNSSYTTRDIPASSHHTFTHPTYQQLLPLSTYSSLANALDPNATMRRPAASSNAPATAQKAASSTPRNEISYSHSPPSDPRASPPPSNHVYLPRRPSAAMLIKAAFTLPSTSRWPILQKVVSRCLLLYNGKALL